MKHVSCDVCGEPVNDGPKIEVTVGDYFVVMGKIRTSKRFTNRSERAHLQLDVCLECVEKAFKEKYR